LWAEPLARASGRLAAVTRIYDDLAAWWPLLSAPEGYAEEAAIFAREIETASRRPVRDVLELGAGGGNNASHLKARWTMTLSDRSPGMLAVSRARNPECEHVEGDMRTLRLSRVFDAVFVHDAVMYLATEADLRAGLATAYAHTRPGGVALVVPDDTAETWRPTTSHGGHDGAGRGLRYLEWKRCDGPSRRSYEVLYALLLREDGRPPRAEVDVHRLGLFPRATWLAALADAGFEAEARPFLHSSFDPDAGRVLFVGTRPEA
jgi:SAM-dependent methyltransferase